MLGSGSGLEIGWINFGEGGRGLLTGLSSGFGKGGGGRVGPLAREPVLLVSDNPRARFLVSTISCPVLLESSGLSSSSSELVSSSS